MRKRNRFVAKLYNWQEKFSKCKPIPDIKKYHCLTFSEDSPGCVSCKVWSNDISSTDLRIFHESDMTVDLSAISHPVGLSTERKTYLFEKNKGLLQT